MALGEHIRELRTAQGVSQELLAERMGVSRQMLARWELNRATPSIEHLFELSNLLGRTVDDLFGMPGESKPATAEALCALYQVEERAQSAARRARWRKNRSAFLWFAGAYLFIYLLGRLIWCTQADVSFLGWLALDAPAGKGSYLYGWLLSSGLYWPCAALSAFPALLGKRRFSAATLTGFALGLVLGMLFGPYPAGAAYGHGHYGWAIWGGVFLVCAIVGLFLEVSRRRA